MSTTTISTEIAAPATPDSIPRYVVMTSGAKMPGSVKSRYRNVAVIETDGQDWPKFIGIRARHLVRIVTFAGPLYEGITERSAYGRAYAEAEALAARLNEEG